MTMQLNMITRFGVLNHQGKSSPHQCGSVGAALYEYELKVLFAHGVKLDERGFIIDHADLDAAMQKVAVDSCEVMAIDGLDRVDTLLTKSGIRHIGTKIKIRPMQRIEGNSAFFQQFRSVDDQNIGLVMNL